MVFGAVGYAVLGGAAGHVRALASFAVGEGAVVARSAFFVVVAFAAGDAFLPRAAA